MEGQIIVSKKELKRIPVLQKLITGIISEKTAAEELKTSTRNIRRLKKRYKEKGVEGLTHKSRGIKSNNKTSKETREIVMEIIRKNYADFGPTLAIEKLIERHNIVISRETLRKWMIEDLLWKVKSKKDKKIHQLRERRSREGELLQIDGSPHDWFEGRGNKCCLIVFIDDATSKTIAKFFKSETTNAYFDTMKEYLNKYGKPVAIYSDQHAIFKININRKEKYKSYKDEDEDLTQFGRAMKELDIELIYARSPQAKGRVERVNQTLQDRLVKELRLAGISTMEEANKFLPKFIEEHNKRFSVVAKSNDNAHRKLEEKLDLILVKKEKRKLSNNLIFQYKTKLYQIETKRPKYAMAKRKVFVIENDKREIKVLYENQELAYKIVKRQPKENAVVSSKDLNEFLDKICKEKEFNIIEKRKPSQNHPWRSRVNKEVLQTCTN